MAGGRQTGRKNPASRRRSEPRTEKEETKEGKGIDEMGMGMLKWISSQFDNFAGDGTEPELELRRERVQDRTVCTVLLPTAGTT